MNQAAEQNIPLLECRNLKKHFKVRNRGLLHAVDGVSFEINRGDTLGLVGESGCGKSTVGNLIMQLHQRTDGEILYRGRNIFEMTASEKFDLCKKMQIVFQDPFSSLNPRKTIAQILSEPYKIHGINTASQLNTKLHELCDLVDIPENLLDHYPHELDGGMRQVVGIARALSLQADFIVCDEPVSSLDVSVQAHIINLLMDLQKKMNLTYLFISHDLSIVRHISKRVAVMYLGQIVEMADSDELFSNTFHPYSIALLSAVPVIDTEAQSHQIVLEGDVPSPMNPKPGCRFAPRCWMRQSDCSSTNPPLREISPGHCVACHYAEKASEMLEKMRA